MPALAANDLEVVAAYAACAEHPTALIPHAVIKDTARGLIPWEDWPHLRAMLDAWMVERRSVVNKSRQLGVSWAAALYAVWTAKFREGANVLLLSQSQGEAADLLDKCRTLESNFPTWLRHGRGKDNDTELEFPALGSRIQALPSTERAGRSNQATLVVLDEFAFHPHAEANLTALLPTVGDSGQLIAVSTANGMAGAYYGLWKKAADMRFVRHFIGWDARPDRDADWYAEKAAELGEMVRQEYPSSADEAFLQSGRPVFPNVDRDPSLVALPSAKRPKAVPAETLVYRLPRKDRLYVIGADVAQGLKHGDNSVAVVLEIDPLDHSGVEAAHLCGLWPEDVFALYLDSLAQFYGGRLAVERNGPGGAVLDHLIQLMAQRVKAQARGGAAERQKYVLHHSHDPLKPPTALGTPVTTQVAGWWTDKRSKGMMISELESALRQRALRFGTFDMLLELQAYQRADDGSMDAPENEHDDRVIAFAISWQMVKWAGANPQSLAHLPKVRVA